MNVKRVVVYETYKDGKIEVSILVEKTPEQAEEWIYPKVFVYRRAFE